MVLAVTNLVVVDSVESDVQLVLLNNIEKKNALSFALLHELKQTLSNLHHSDSGLQAQTLILSGGAEMFSAGAI